MVIKRYRELRGESAFGERPASSISKCSAGVNSDLGNGSFFFFFFFFFVTQVQTPVTLCSGELWSVLVVRLAHSADLRSRLRHVSSPFGSKFVTVSM